MKDGGRPLKNNEEKGRCGGVRIVPVPDFITCMECGYEIEFWTDEEETRCPVCGHKVFRKETTVH